MDLDAMRRAGGLALSSYGQSAGACHTTDSGRGSWERALNLQRLAEQRAARRLFYELADGRWGSDFKEIQEDARWEMEHGGSEN
jgi:hypothetical protein